MKLNRRVGHLEPSDINSSEEIIWKRRHLATVDDKVVDLVAAKAFDCIPENLRVLDVPAIGDYLNLCLLVHLIGVLGEEPGQAAPILSALRGGAQASALFCGANCPDVPIVGRRRRRRNRRAGRRKLLPGAVAVRGEYLAAGRV